MSPPRGPKKPAFKPSYEEIWDRAEAVQWMTHMGWPDDVVDSIMFDDTPGLDSLQFLVWKLGPLEALRVIEDYIFGACNGFGFGQISTS